MSEADFFPSSAGQFRGSKYPGFTGGSTDASGNFTPVGVSANVSQSTGNNSTPAQVQQQQVDKGNTSATTGGTLGTPANSTPPSANASALNQQSVPQGLGPIGNVAAQTLLPAAGNIAGTAIGSSLGGGASLGSALGEGGKALGTAANNLASGNIGGLLGTSGGAAAGSTGASTSAGVVDGLQGVNVGTAGIDKLGENAVSEGVGAAGEGAAEGANIGGGALAGVGTFAADLISGKSLKDSAFEGAGATAGGIAGSYLGPVGTIVGSFIGSKLGGLLGGLVGNSKPSVGPDGYTGFTINNGLLGVGNSGADNGADVNTTISAANASSTSINKILNDNNLQIDPTKLQAGTDGYVGLSLNQGDDSKVGGGTMPHSALDVWNFLQSKNAIVSKTPSAPTPATTSSNVVYGNNAPVLTAAR